MRLFIIHTLLIVLLQSGNSQNWNWAKSYGGLGNESIPSMKINSSSEILIAGTYTESIDLGSTTLDALQGSDAFLLKLDDQGLPIWAVSGGSFNNDLSIDVEIDQDGNILWLGQYWVEAYFENDTIQAGTNSKAYFVAKYDSSGQLIWVQSINGTATKVVNDLTINPENDIYLTGYFSDQLMAGSLTLTSVAAEDAFVLKIDADGTPTWANQYGNTGTIRPQRIEVNSIGHIVIAGDLTGSVTFADDDLVSVSTDFDIFIAIIDDNGQPLKGNIGSGVFDNHVHSLSIDQNDNIYISGHFIGVLEIENQEILTPGFIENLFLLKFNPNGNLLWLRGLDDQTFNDPSFSFDIAIKDDLVLMTGQFIGALLIDDLQLQEVNTYKGFIASFDGIDGTVEKLSQISGTAQTSGNQISVGSEGQLYLAGSFSETVMFGTESLSSQGGIDFFIAQASPTFTALPFLPFNEPTISIYPNPASDQLFLIPSNPTFNIDVYNIQGQWILSAKNQAVLNIESLLPGSYYLNYQSPDSNQILPFIKMGK